MRMKAYLLVAVLSVLIVQLGFTHPAHRVNVSYNQEDQMLTVTVEHSTRDVNKHYIDQIVVERNGKEIIQQTFGLQLDQEEQKAVYFIPDVNNGDEIAVTARCSVYGKKKAKIKIETE